MHDTTGQPDEQRAGIIGEFQCDKISIHFNAKEFLVQTSVLDREHRKGSEISRPTSKPPTIRAESEPVQPVGMKTPSCGQRHYTLAGNVTSKHFGSDPVAGIDAKHLSQDRECLSNIIALQQSLHSLSPDRFTRTPWSWDTARVQAARVYETYYGV